jgi:hypothetical protein
MDAGWADSTMRRDEFLDLQEVQLCSSGQDTRYGCPGSASSFQFWANRWGVVVAQVDDIGAQLLFEPGSQTFPTKDALGTSMIWFAEAISAHTTDEQQFPQNADWDSGWIAAYNRLTALYEAVP